MRCLMLLPLVLAAPFFAAAADQPKAPLDAAGLEAAARQFVGRLEKSDYAACLEKVAAFAKSRYSAERLKTQWQSVLDEHGALQKIDSVACEIRPAGKTAIVRLQFAKGTHDLRLGFNDDRELTGLSFLASPLGGPGLIRCAAGVSVQPEPGADAGVITLPIPGLYREQVPLAFKLSAEPENALISWKWVKRPDGMNWLCEAKVKPPKGGAHVRWETLVLVNERPTVPLPPAAKPEVPPGADVWLRSAACVQSADPDIKKKADELAAGADEVGAYAWKVCRFAAANPVRHAENLAMTLDARAALDCGGSCTSRANLAAALLRARGIPARTVAHLPTWVERLYEHWLVEYWHPGVGWVWLEPSLTQSQPSPTTLVVLNVANPEDEDKAFDPVHVKHVMAGAPYLACPLLDSNLKNSFFRGEQIGSFAKPEVRLKGTEAEMAALNAAAQKRFALLAEQAGKSQPTDMDALLAAARAGGPAALMEALSGKKRP